MNPLKIGDEVKWMVAKSTRNGFSFSTKRGKIVAIDNISADVKGKGSKIYTVSKSEIVPISEPSPVKNVFDAFAQ